MRCFCFFGIHGALEARTIDFEDLYHPDAESPSVYKMPEGYAGFNWSWFFSNDKWPGTNGYVYGTIGQTSCVTTNYATMSKADGGYFDFYGAYISDAYFNGTVVVEGYRDGTKIYDGLPSIAIYEPNLSLDPTFYTFNYEQIDTLKFYNEYEVHMCLDNITIGNEIAGVPIPGAIWLLGSGLIGIVGIRRKFKN